MGKRRKHKAKTNQAKWKAVADVAKAAESVDVAVIERPTPERMARGIWSIGTKTAPVIDLACDMIGELYATNQITYSQHEAARMFQDVIADYMADLALPGFRSCLAEGFGGYDSGDGDIEAARRYTALQRRCGSVRFIFLRSETDKPAGSKPGNIEALRKALDFLAGGA
jgi:hypothetical protein